MNLKNKLRVALAALALATGFAVAAPAAPASAQMKMHSVSLPVQDSVALGSNWNALTGPLVDQALGSNWNNINVDALDRALGSNWNNINIDVLDVDASHPCQRSRLPTFSTCTFAYYYNPRTLTRY